MRNIALETTGRTGSLAVLDDDTVRAELELPSEQRSARSLAPGIQALLAEVAWQAHELDLVAVAVGPGSFTGLRIGVTTAKILAYAAEAAIVGVDTLEAIARRAPSDLDSVEVVMDAERGQLFAARFAHPEDGCFRKRSETRIVDIDTWLADLKAGTVVTGPALRKLAERIPSGIPLLDEGLWVPTARSVGQLGVRAYREGRQDDLWKIVPKYYRKSAAEERKEMTND